MSDCHSYRKEAPVCTCLRKEAEDAYFSTPGNAYTRRPIKSLVKDHQAVVYDSLIGNALTNKNLVVLENHCIILRRDHKSMKGKVKIIGGGGSGIEPAEAYYVGKGMLTAAVLGEIFTSPPVDEILLAIRELAVDNPDGILLLVKNYMGDTLNFGLAMDQALKENITIKMLVIDDDIYNHNPARYGRKGLAGSVLVYKIIGEMAEQMKTLEEIIEECREKILDNLATVSATLVPCNISACDSLSHFIGSEELMLGVGIYGKGGAKKIKITGLNDIVSLMLEEILSFLKSNSKSFQNDVVVLINNLGATTKVEEAVIAKEVSFQLNKLGFRIVQLYVGTFMSSMGSQGFSISLLKINSPEIVKFLKSSTAASAWPKTDLEDSPELNNLPVNISLCSPTDSHDHHHQLEDNKCPNVLSDIVLSGKAMAAVKQITIFATEALISCEKQLNIIDSEAGDGDAGTILKKGANALKMAVINEEIDFSMPSKFLFEIGEICGKFMGGLSGALYSVFFKAAGKAFQNSAKITPELCCTAFAEAVKAIKCYGGAELGDRTVLDVLYPAVGSFESALKHGKSLTEAVYLAAVTCEFKSEETKLQTPYTLQHKNICHPLLYPDAGAHAATIWLRAITFDSETPTPQAGIFVWKFITEEESNYVLEKSLCKDDLLNFIEKKIGPNQTLQTFLLVETLKFCRKNYKKDAKRTSALMGTVFYTHNYFTASRWRTPAEVYFYFRESILRQSVESPPTSMEIFEPEEAKDALIFFFETYVRNLPIISILHLPHFKLSLRLLQDNLPKDQPFYSTEKKKKSNMS